MMGHLQEVDPGQAQADQLPIHVLLGIAGQQEPPPVHVAEHHDRDVVDAHPGAWWAGRDAPAIWPEHPEDEVIHHQLVACAQGAVVDPRRFEGRGCGAIAGSWGPAMPGPRTDFIARQANQ